MSRIRRNGERVARRPCEKMEDAAPKGAAIPLSLPPPPIRMQPAPFAVSGAVLAEKHAETHAGFAVAPLAQLMEADHLRLARILGHYGGSRPRHP